MMYLFEQTNTRRALGVPSRGGPFNDVELQAWHGMLRAHAQVIRALDRELSREHRMSVSEFDVLITLDNAPPRGLRMSELAAAVMLSFGGLTRLVMRLERAGYVERAADPDDGRGSLARLTAGGREALAQARRTHNEVIRRLYLERMTSSDQRAVGRAWSRVLDSTADR
jgi:DNA-binding MarR family transcriptional regulator